MSQEDNQKSKHELTAIYGITHWKPSKSKSPINILNFSIAMVAWALILFTVRLFI